MDIQRLRNLTTGRLHTDIPWLRENVKDERFWDGEFDTTHVGDYDLPMPTKEDQKVFFERFAEMPNPLAGKEVIGVAV